MPSLVAGQDGAQLTGCTAVATGDGTSCAICNGALLCWGGDYESELGRGMRAGGTDEHAAPVTVPPGIAFSELAAGSNHTCAIGEGRMFCWGWGVHGELGNGARGTNLPVPLAPPR